MIYCLISNIESEKVSKEKNKSKVIYRIESPINYLPEDLREYIEKTKNEPVRTERLSAYTSLLCGLRCFFNIEKFSVKRTSKGKPYIVTNKSSDDTANCGDKKIYISISHSDGVCAVAFSDEGEIGIDLQSEIDKERADRLSKRFFEDLEYKNEKINFEMYFCKVNDDEATIEKIPSDFLEELNQNDFSTDKIFSVKWTFAESKLKLFGGGFSDIKKLQNINEKVITEIKKITLAKTYYLALSTTLK